MLIEVINPDYQGETGLVVQSEDKEDHVWGAGLHPLLFPCLVINRLEQKKNCPERTKNGPEPSGM